MGGVGGSPSLHVYCVESTPGQGLNRSRYFFSCQCVCESETAPVGSVQAVHNTTLQETPSPQGRVCEIIIFIAVIFYK